MIKILDIILAPITFFASIWLKLIRRYNVGLFRSRSNISKKIFEFVGVFPITDHYYEPYVGKHKVEKNRLLTGIDLKIEEQLVLLEKFNFNDELLALNNLPKNPLTFSFFKGPFRSGDAEICYNVVRFFQPTQIVEIGCGHSSMLMQHAIAKNYEINSNYSCNHICIEPFEAAYLKDLKVDFFKKSVTEMDLSIFKSLNAGDILFIDSSHIIRPGGDVLFEYLTILPILKSGVLIHVHDIFTPNHYLKQWTDNGVNFWNEQYLLEAFLSCNPHFEILLSVNFLKNSHYESLKNVCPILEEDREPGSFWIRRI
jgi:hypothetical protein